MASNLEMRVLRLEANLQRLTGQVSQLTDLVGQLQQQQYQPGGGMSGGGGGGATVFFADHLALGASSGSWPSITPSSVVSDVYKITSGAFSLVGSGLRIYNGLPDPTDATKRQILGSNGDGTYTVISQSCSAG